MPGCFAKHSNTKDLFVEAVAAVAAAEEEEEEAAAAAGAGANNLDFEVAGLASSLDDLHAVLDRQVVSAEVGIVALD